MGEAVLTPLGAATARVIRDIKQPGFLAPVRERDQAMLITECDGKMCAVMLGGERSFSFFSISSQSPHTGLFFPTPEILIDLTSVKDARNIEQEQGLLILSKDSLAVVASETGNHFSDPEPVALWKAVEGGSDVAKVAFTRWGVGLAQGDGFRILWERSKSVGSFYKNVD